MRDKSIFGYSHLYDFIIAATNDLLIDQELVEKYSKNDIESINEEIDIEYDDFDYSGINLMDKRYLIKYGNKTVEPPQFMYALTAMVVFKNVSDRARRLELIKEYYTLMALQIISPATPNLSNLRKYGRGSSPSCFILKAEDDLESIYDVNKMAAIISKNGGASGISISSIRASGSPIKGVKNAAKGVLPWMRLFNDTAVAVDQLGTRTGAITVTLDVWHKDIFDFLDMRKENIDLRLQSQDLFGQIAVNDVFLEVYNQSVKSQSKEPDWLTFCPYVFKELTGIEIENTWGETFRVAYNHAVSLYESGELYNAVKVSSRALMKKILEAAKESGLPYWFNKDYVNHCNPNKHRGVINSSNLCTESFSTFNAEYSHVCNLHSINLSKGIEDKDIERAVRMSVIALNQIVTLSTSPLESTRKHNDEFRIIGIGALGYHDHLVKKGMYYAKSASYAYELFEKIAYWAIDESVNEVTHIGEYPAFSGSDWESGVFFGRSVYLEDFSDTPGMNEKWIRLYEDKVAKFGMANGGLLAIAPNTGCQPGDQKIIFNHGEMSIYEILLNEGISIEEANSFEAGSWINLSNTYSLTGIDGEDVVDKIYVNGVSETIAITFDDDNTYEFTPNHKLLVIRDNKQIYVECRFLKEGDDIVNF